MRCSERIREFLAVVAAPGLKLAVEIMPFQYFGGYRRFLEVCEHPRGSAPNMPMALIISRQTR